MTGRSRIEWTDVTWNPVTGCTRIGPGCDHCYAERFAERWRGIAGHPYEQGFDLRLWPDRVDRPHAWRAPRRVFVNSMSDMFHKSIPAGFIDDVFGTMERVDRHTYQLLTKRSSLMRRYVNRRYPDAPAPGHIWLGVSIEDADHAGRLRHLRATNASVRFVSFEPLLGRIGPVDLAGISWAIVGGESGPDARPMHADWARELRDQCLDQGTKFFFKQWGGARPTSGGRVLDGRTWDDLPPISASISPA